MKINFQIDSEGLYLADEESEAKYKKLKPGTYSFDVKLNQNYKLHKKIFGFFSFCCIHYYGDIEAAKNEYNLDYVRKQLTILAGYSEQVFNRDGGFKVVARSLKYEKMSPEERGEFYKRLVDAALENVFDRTTDDNILNQVKGWF